MSTAKIIFKNGITGDNKIEIDGHDLAGITNAATIDLTAGGIPRISLDMLITSCEISTDGQVEINATCINDFVGRKILESLKEKYGQDSELKDTSATREN